jgi:hypothetical protein
MATKEERSAVQAAADSGELQGVRNKAELDQIRHRFDAALAHVIDRKWIVEQAIKVAVAHDMPGDEFRALVTFLDEFVSKRPPEVGV